NSLVNGACPKEELTQTPSYNDTSEEESRQMEEILRLEREIERLQKQQEDGVSLLGDVSREEMRQMRDAEIYRLEKEASRVATEFLELLDFGGLEPSLSSEENLHEANECAAPLAEDEVDEGFPTEDECVPLPDFPPPAAVPLDKDVFQSIPPPPPGFAEGVLVSPSPVARSASGKLTLATLNGFNHTSVLTDSQTCHPPQSPHIVTNGDRQPCQRTSRTSDFVPLNDVPSQSNLPDAESDYDQEEFEEAHGSSGVSINDGHITDEEVLQESSCTQNSLDSFRGSSDSVRNSKHCSVLLNNCGLMIPWRRRWCVLKDETFMWFRAKQDSLKSGWLYKKGGGMSTLSRRNWKMRCGWFNVLSRVHSASPEQLLEMHHEQANPKNAVGTLDVGLIDSVCASDNPDRPNSFVIITANRVIHCNTDTPEEMHHWIGLLQKSKGDTRVDGQEFLVRGWLHKEMKSGVKSTSLKLKKRWFVLTTNSLDYYKSSERNATKLGTLVLNSLCSVLQPDEKVFKDTVQKEKGYTSLQDEAVKIFNSLQEMEAVSDPVPIIQGILQTCQDLRPLRDEVYCQLIKQTNHVTHPNSPANRAHWHLLTCMSCTFLPSRGILRYLRFHLKR
ncbi:hypothetical protein XENOCAPTIV_014391, partial [Xenoophorus captivus]